MLKFLALLSLIVAFSGLSAQKNTLNLDGDLMQYSASDFLGFDEVGDATGPTGDISSAFLRFQKETPVLRISFDNMVERKNNRVFTDLFSQNEVSVAVAIFHKTNSQLSFTWDLDVRPLENMGPVQSFLRTPENNLLEIVLDKGYFDPESVLIKITVTVNGKKTDEMIVDGGGSKDTGNCAFVHHGNQGLTYTDVFYGNAFGISGLDGSGFDEVLQVHESTGIPGNFHMSGTLMPAAEWHNPEFNNWLYTMAQNGLASMMTSALGQHIMPFMTNEMNDWSVYTETQMVQHFYNYTPRIAWIPERVWLAPGYYPEAGVIDWLGDNWSQYGVWGVVLDDGPHLNGYDNRKIHWMNNGSGISLRVIPINNSFVGNMHYDVTAAKNQIASMGQYQICVYGTDWEVAAEMNEHDGTFFLDNYENVLWYCHDNFPGINVWKLEDAIQNPDFNGTGAEITPGTYGLLGGSDGYGGSNNSWYINWASTPSHSDFHDPQWDYGTIWSDAYNFLMSVNDNGLSQLGWYTLMINLHETGWHTSGEIADWEHRYSSHIKNANVYTEASRWADGEYVTTTACYFDDIDRDGTDELVMHNDKVFMVFESIGGKANWVFYKNGFGDAYSVVSSDMAYWAETDGDYNESSNNHVAALSDVSPNQQNSIYNISIIQSSGDTVIAILDQWGVQKTLKLYTGVDYLDVEYNFFGQTGYIKSGWSPDLLDLIWSGKNNLERVWGDYGSYCGYRNSSSGATAALILGNGGGQHNLEFEGTLVKGDEIKGHNKFKVRLYAGYTSSLTGSTTPELNTLAAENLEVFPPELYSPAALLSSTEVILSFDEAVDLASAEDIANYLLVDFSNSYTLLSAQRQSDWSKVKLTIAETFVPGDAGEIQVSNIEDLYGNTISTNNTATLSIPTGITPHTIVIDGINDFISETELMEDIPQSLYISWDQDNLYVGLFSLDLGSGGDFFVSIDTDQTAGSGATTGCWGRVNFSGNYLPEFQVAIEGGGGSMQVNNWTGTAWNYPGNGAIGNSYEGWTNNGMTEISIPWSDLGNPTGIAISAHITEEDTQIATAIYPDLNMPGNLATITYFYAFFSPYISANMPLSAFEPNAAFIVPNTPVEIVSFDPLESEISMLAGESLSFSVIANDSEDDPILYTCKLDGTAVGSSNSYLYEPMEGDIGNHILRIIASDGVPGNGSDTATWAIEVVEAVINLNLKVYLEGAFNGSAMHTLLNSQNLIPLTQPYDLSPWNYPGDEEVLTIPGINIVDWVLIELRDAPSASLATPATIVARQAAFLHADGSIKTINGDPDLDFGLIVNDSLYAVVYHRDHLAIMSSVALTETTGVYSYDFSTSASKVYGGQLGYKEIATGIWGMVGGDADANGTVDELDKTVGWESSAGITGYTEADFQLDGQVNNQDKNEIWIPNSGTGTQLKDINFSKYQTQVPN
ncbi:MAG: hypothetical protein KQI35_00585 [Bacteroidetes bacterium]|nr:hypothetical protein [Bacteroidota bacterium]